MIVGVAATGTTQATAFPLQPSGSVVAYDVQVVPSGSGVMLPYYSYSAVDVLIRNSGTNSLLIYPLIGGTINGSASAVTLASGAVLELRSFSQTDWVQNVQGGAGLGSVTSVAFVGDGTILSSTPSAPVTTAGNVVGSLNTQSANVILAGPATGSAATPTFRALVTADMPLVTVPVGGTGLNTLTPYAVLCGGTTSTGAMQQVPDVGTAGQVLTSNGPGVIPTFQDGGGGGGSGTVTSVALTLPPFITVAGSPVTTSGTLAGTLATQSPNMVFAGPTIGSPAAPTFRALVSSDLPAGIGTVSSVALALPSSIIAVSGSPVTTTGTLTGTLATQAANFVWAGPTTGSPAAPAFRALVSADLPTVQSTHQVNFVLGGGTDLTVATNASAFYPVMPAGGTFTRWDIVAKVPSVGASIVIDVFKSSNQGSTWVNLWSTSANYPTLAAAAIQASGTLFDTASFSAGDILRVDIVQVGTTTKGQGVTLALVAQY